MSEFQTSLLLIGAVVVAGVFAYNKWQERRATREADSIFKSDHPDVLIGDAQIVAPPRAGTRDDERIEPGIDNRPLVGAEKTTAEKGDSGAPDALVDYVVDLVFNHPISVSTVHECWGRPEHRFARRATMSGWIDGEWGVLPQGGVCEKVRFALQLVSRKGVLGESELLEFRSEVETLASKLGTSAFAPEMRESLEAARELDAVCVEADIQVAFHVMAPPGEPFAGTKLRAAAESSGFLLDGEGRFALRDERGRELYSLSDRSGTLFSAATMKEASPAGLTLSMDVPRAPDTQRTFEAMVRFGRQLSSVLGGVLVDDNNRPLDDRSVAAIDAQLTIVRRALDAQGIVPGSALALRLFS